MTSCALRGRADLFEVETEAKIRVLPSIVCCEKCLLIQQNNCHSLYKPLMTNNSAFQNEIFTRYVPTSVPMEAFGNTRLKCIAVRKESARPLKVKLSIVSQPRRPLQKMTTAESARLCSKIKQRQSSYRLAGSRESERCSYPVN